MRTFHSIVRFTGVFVAFSQSVLAATDIPLISFGADGLQNVVHVPRDTYSQVVEQSVSAVHDSFMPELSCAQESKGRWKLDTIIVGVGIGATFGLGPIISVQAKPRIRLLYARGKEPTYPIQ